MSNKEKRRALGRGLGALLPSPTPSAPPSDAPPPQPAAPESATPRPPESGADAGASSDKRSYFQAAVEDVFPNPEQPRRHFDAELLDELAASIRSHGIIQPLIVRRRAEGGYVLIAGERRWRASQRAGLRQVPIVVQDIDSREAFERAIVENLQRSDLNAIEEAQAFQRLVEEYGYSQEEVAERVGKDRSTVSNSLRLLKLPPPVRAMVEDGKLSMGHARALLGLEGAADIEVCARQVAARGLSVRATESLVRARAAPPSPAKAAPAVKSASVRDLESKLTQSLGARVSVQEDGRGRGGTIAIRYADLDDLDRLLEALL